MQKIVIFEVYLTSKRQSKLFLIFTYEFGIVETCIIGSIFEEGLPQGYSLILLDLPLLEITDFIDGLEVGLLLNYLNVIAFLGSQVSELPEDVD
jgi:hypothetical protein